MKTYLPYRFKKIGIIIVLIAIALSFIAGANEMEKGCIEGGNFVNSAHPFPNIKDVPSVYVEIISPGTANTLNWISIVFSMSGFLMYIFSSEKIEDEFIQKLRYQSLEKSLIITWFVALLFFIFKQVEFEAFYVLQIQMIAYVIIFHRYKQQYLTNL
jgi:amino acid permease